LRHRQVAPGVVCMKQLRMEFWRFERFYTVYNFIEPVRQRSCDALCT
jgi:hypothetical protein